MKRVIKWSLWVAAFFCVFMIFGDGWWKLPGVLSIFWMAGSTIATWIDEGRQQK